jgi:hypothetical protein
MRPKYYLAIEYGGCGDCDLNEDFESWWEMRGRKSEGGENPCTLRSEKYENCFKATPIPLGELKG